LQVAQLAGVPQPVIRAARKHLAALEAHSVQATPQFDLFAGGIAEVEEAVDAAEPLQSIEVTAVMAALAETDPDALSPREALDALYRLKNLAGRQ
jgi:DNA mismatch repair protein MutS